MLSTCASWVTAKADRYDAQSFQETCLIESHQVMRARWRMLGDTAKRSGHKNCAKGLLREVRAT